MNKKVELQTMSTSSNKKGKKSAQQKPKNGNMASQLKNLIPTNGQQQQRGVRDQDRVYPKWTEEQVEAFLTTGQVPESFETAQDEELGATVHQECAICAMPAPRSLDSVFGGEIESRALGTSSTSDEPTAAVQPQSQLDSKLGQTAILSSLLDPDAGGQGRNKDGLLGLLSAKPKPKINLPPDRRHPNESQERRELRARLRARVKASQNQRGPMQDSQVVYDAKGRRVRNARQPNADDAPYVKRPSGTVSGQTDAEATAKQRQAMFETIRAKLAAKKLLQEQNEQNSSANNALVAKESDDDEESSSSE